MLTVQKQIITQDVLKGEHNEEWNQDNPTNIMDHNDTNKAEWTKKKSEQNPGHNKNILHPYWAL